LGLGLGVEFKFEVLRKGRDTCLEIIKSVLHLHLRLRFGADVDANASLIEQNLGRFLIH
jgi:hypothetical protein